MTDTARGGDTSRRGQSLGRMLAVQLSAYLIMSVVILAHWYVGLSELFVVAVAAVVVLAYAFDGPCTSTGRVRVIERIATAVFGMVSLVVAAFSPVGADVVGGAGAKGFALLAGTVVERWSFAFVVLVVVLVVFGFIHQMARERRDHLVRDLSYSVLNGIAAIAVSGWVVTARFWGAHESYWRIVAAGPVGVVSIVLAVVLMVVLVLISCQWWKEYDVPGAAWLWVGFGLLPMMVAGLLPVLASAAILLL